MTVSEVRFSSQWAMAERGTIAPDGVAAVVVLAGAPAEEVLSIANGREVTPVGIPVRVPELMAAAVVDSLLEAAMAAMLEATAFVPVEAVGVLGLMEVLELLLELTSCPAEVGNAAVAPGGAEVDPGVGGAEAAGAGAAAVAVDPRRGTDGEEPVLAALM